MTRLAAVAGRQTVHLSAPSGYTGPRRSLILAGGGMRVAYQAGVLRALEESGICFAHGDGTSGGTINLAMLFSGLSPAEMCGRWRSLAVRDFVSLMPLTSYTAPLEMPALGDADGIERKVFPHLGIDVARINAAEGMAGTFNVCNFTRKTNVPVPHQHIEMARLIAGISLPIFMPPVKYGSDLYTDSVWIKDANLTEAVRRGSEELWLVWCIGNTPTYNGGPFNQYVHMIEMSANGVLFEELDRIKERNALGEAGGAAAPVRLHVIKPQYPLPLDPDLYLGRIDAATLIAMGYRDACRYLAVMRPEGVPLDDGATAMTTPAPGISFRETLSGSFAPSGGGDVRISVDATVIIRDLEAFFAAADGAAELVGSLDIPSWGPDILIQDGHLRVVTPPGDRRRRALFYEMVFSFDGRRYCLSGTKQIGDDRGLDLWADITTVSMTLHDGGDRSGPIAGRGVLRLDAPAMARLVKSTTATGVESPGERVATVGRFGRYLLGELWERLASEAT